MNVSEVQYSFTVRALTTSSFDQPPIWRGNHLVLSSCFRLRCDPDSGRLVATLGSKSNLKKVTRKAILDVDVPKACVKITDPAAPLALRLQGSLLYSILPTHMFASDPIVAMASRESIRNNAHTSWPTLRASASRCEAFSKS
jgi:N terminus of Rad21 / Rec8 like protein